MVRSRTLVSTANILVFAGLLGLSLLVSALTWDRLATGRALRGLSDHSFVVLGAIKDLDLAVRGAETGQRGYLLTGRDDYLAPYEAALGRVGVLEGTLQRLTANDPAAQRQLADVSPLIQRKLEELAQTIELRRKVGLPAAMQVVDTDIGRDLMRGIETSLDLLVGEQQSLLATRLAARDHRSLILRGLVFGGSVIAAVALLWAAWLLNLALARARSLEADERALAQRLRTSLDSLSQGVAVFDAEHRLTNWNHCFQVLLELAPALLHDGLSYADCAASFSLAGACLESEAQIEDATKAGSDAISYEAFRPDGRHLELRRTPMPDGGFVLTVTDMTKRVQAEAVVREAQKMQAIGQLTGGIAHDFNNLLTVILGNLELARSRVVPTDAPLQARLDRAVWAAQRGAALTAQLLAFARKQPLAPSAVDLGVSIPEFIPLLRRTLGEHIEVRFVDSAGLWPAMADLAQLESAVLNLALNARDAMPGGGRLTIELANKVLDAAYAAQHSEVTPGDYAMIAVSDTGHGMTPEIAARVFEPFFTTKLDGKGTGLGLAMVFGFVKQSNGHVKIYSEPDEGTTVRIYLPRAVAVRPVARLDQRAQVPRGTATILVVEDEAAVREIAVTILRDLGYRVIEAADAEEGLRVFGAHDHSIDLLLTDVVLPGRLRGRDLVERVTAIRPSIRTLYMSGYTENAIVHQGRLDDGVQLISKPFQRDQLARKVAEVLAAEAPTPAQARIGAVCQDSEAGMSRK